MFSHHVPLVPRLSRVPGCSFLLAALAVEEDGSGGLSNPSVGVAWMGGCVLSRKTMEVSAFSCHHSTGGYDHGDGM